MLTLADIAYNCLGVVQILRYIFGHPKHYIIIIKFLFNHNSINSGSVAELFVINFVKGVATVPTFRLTFIDDFCLVTTPPSLQS